MPYEVRARPYSETSAACAAAVAFDDAPRVLTPTQFDDDDDEEEEEEEAEDDDVVGCMQQRLGKRIGPMRVRPWEENWPWCFSKMLMQVWSGELTEALWV